MVSVRNTNTVPCAISNNSLTLESTTTRAAFANSWRGSRCQCLGHWQPVALVAVLWCGLTRCRFVPAHCGRLYPTGANGEPAHECRAASVISLFLESTAQSARAPRVFGN